MRVKHRYVSQPAYEPVTVDECRLHLGDTQAGDTSRDPIIASRIITSRIWAQDYTSSVLATAQNIMSYVDRFPCHPSSAIGLLMPLLTVIAVRYYDVYGILQTVDPGDYIVDTVDGYVYPVNVRSWPTTQARANAVHIEYSAGYNTVADIPEPIKDAIKFTVGQWENYQGTIEGGQRPMTIPYAALQLLGMYRDYRGAF